jgi:hypothetical protein
MEKYFMPPLNLPTNQNPLTPMPYFLFLGDVSHFDWCEK